MRIRDYQPEDMIKVHEIWRNFFSKEFEFPDFEDKFHYVFIVENDEGEIIVTAGVRPIAEIICLTDKNQSIRDKHEALQKTFEIAKLGTANCGYDQLHAFIQNEKWLQHLLAHGFVRTKGQSLVIEV